MCAAHLYHLHPPTRYSCRFFTKWPFINALLYMADASPVHTNSLPNFPDFSPPRAVLATCRWKPATWKNQQAPKTRWPLVLSAGELTFHISPGWAKVLGDFDKVEQQAGANKSIGSYVGTLPKWFHGICSEVDITSKSGEFWECHPTTKPRHGVFHCRVRSR